MRFFPALGVAVLLFTGCSTTIPVNYVASPVIRGQGNVKPGRITYIPALKGEVPANQFQKVISFGAIYLDDSVPNILQQALRKELVAAGFDPDGPENIVIHAGVQRFLFGWTGFVEMDMYLDVKYVVTQDGKIVYEDTIRTHKALPKVAGAESEAIKTTISANISELFTNLRSRKIL